MRGIAEDMKACAKQSPELHLLLEELACQISRQGEANYRQQSGLDRLGANGVPQPKELSPQKSLAEPAVPSMAGRLRDLIAQVRMNANVAHENADRLDNMV